MCVFTGTYMIPARWHEWLCITDCPACFLGDVVHWLFRDEKYEMKLLEAREYSPMPPCYTVMAYWVERDKTDHFRTMLLAQHYAQCFHCTTFPFDLCTRPHIHTLYGHTHMHTLPPPPLPPLTLFPPPPTVKHLPCRRTKRENARVMCVPSNPSQTRKQIKQTHNPLCVWYTSSYYYSVCVCFFFFFVRFLWWSSWGHTREFRLLNGVCVTDVSWTNQRMFLIWYIVMLKISCTSVELLSSSSIASKITALYATVNV